MTFNNHFINATSSTALASQELLVVKNPPASAGDVRDTGSIPGSGRAPGGGNGYPLQYSCLENPMDRGAWQDTVHVITESEMTKYACRTARAYVCWKFEEMPHNCPD